MANGARNKAEISEMGDGNGNWIVKRQNKFFWTEIFVKSVMIRLTVVCELWWRSEGWLVAPRGRYQMSREDPIKPSYIPSAIRRHNYRIQTMSYFSLSRVNHNNLPAITCKCGVNWANSQVFWYLTSVWADLCLQSGPVSDCERDESREWECLRAGPTGDTPHTYSVKVNNFKTIPQAGFWSVFI